MARTGARLGRVSRITLAGDVYVELADVAPGFEFGPCLDTVGDLVVGDRIIAQALARDEDELVITGILGGRPAGGGGITPEELAVELVPYALDTDLTAMSDAIADVLDLKVDLTDPRLTDARTPTAHTHDDRYYTEAEIDALIASTDLKRATVCNNGNMATITGTPTIDGVATAPGDRVLLTGQTNTQNNGLWLIPPDGGAWVRPADYDSGADALAAHVVVQRGTIRGGRIWRNSVASPSVWPVAHTWTDTADVGAILTGTFALARLPVAASGVNSATQLVRADDARLAPAGQAYTPALVNGTLGTGGTLAGRYVQHGKHVLFWNKATFGTGLAVNTACGLTLPVTRHASNVLHGTVFLTKTGVNSYGGFITSSTTAIMAWAIGAGGSYAAVGAASPFTWAAGDSLEFVGAYEAA